MDDIDFSMYGKGHTCRENIRIVVFCTECKYYFAPVCTFYKWLPMTSRKGFCYHAIKGKYEGDAPKIRE